MSKLELTRLTTTRTWGKPPPSPLYYTLYLSMRPTSKWHFVLGLPSENLGIPTTGTLTTLGTHNFVCRPLITMRPKPKLQNSLRSFQRYVACHLNVRKSGRFLTFNGQKSNCQFDSWPFFSLTYVSDVQMGHANPFQTSKFQELSNDTRNNSIH